MVSQADGERLRQVQIAVRKLVRRELTAFFDYLNLSRPEAARDALLEFVPYLVEKYGDSAAAMAADWYDELRAAENVPGRFRALAQPSPYLDGVEGTVRRAAGSLFTDTPTAALGVLLGTTEKYVLAAARQTITTSADRDPRASGWRRITRAGACDFCVLLAGRGAVYKEHTVHFAAHGGATGGECNCAAVPDWDPDAPEVDVKLYEASVRTTAWRLAAARGDQRAVERLAQHNALIQRAIAEYVTH
ncbi:hypothetical protein CHO01_25280 [Cellulomonas hominis]|uniref:Phage head morphogenesis domain-containing protein n=1 Tax=Cellulomonas hominis TaxID=156981 RepID=A0A511FE15_9CELL|nr:hypothetical protein [Cellulomonas hominis]MBB5472494.1 hypothetical protein [Cellulomonas hominis]NKY05526.1 hypothetical protein [Cellulomonas hominis]GEL47412.1 hypothetical protein CHO01_25280 [Cellulomonas hominis]